MSLFAPRTFLPDYKAIKYQKTLVRGANRDEQRLSISEINRMTESSKTVFKKIIDGELPADIVYQDEQCIALNDIAPQAPVHIIVIPKKEIRNLDDLTPEDASIVGHLMMVIQKLTRDLGVNEGYRVLSNCGASAGQTVFHLHFHILAGRPLKWPPG